MKMCVCKINLIKEEELCNHNTSKKMMAHLFLSILLVKL